LCPVVNSDDRAGFVFLAIRSKLDRTGPQAIDGSSLSRSQSPVTLSRSGSTASTGSIYGNSKPTGWGLYIT
jgi:hypothetical protein